MALFCSHAEILFPKFQLRSSYRLEELLRISGASPLFSDPLDVSGLSEKKMLRLVKVPREADHLRHTLPSLVSSLICLVVFDAALRLPTR